VPTFPTPEPITAVVEMAMGHLHIRASERADTVVEVRPGNPGSSTDVQAAEQTVVDLTDGRLGVTTPRNRVRRLFGRPPSVDVTIELPAGSHLEGTVGVGAFACEGRFGDCRLRTGVGDVRIDRAGALNVKTGTGDVRVDVATGHAEVAAGSGDVHLHELDDTGVVKNANGDIHIGSAAGDLRVSVANGSISVDRAQTNVGAKSAKGDVRIGEVIRGSVVLETRAGDLDVGIREGTAAWLDVSSIAGSVHNTLDAADAPEPSAPTVEVRARTTVGDVAIRRA